jgi:hypothetical protein
MLVAFAPQPLREGWDDNGTFFLEGVDFPPGRWATPLTDRLPIAYNASWSKMWDGAEWGQSSDRSRPHV